MILDVENDIRLKVISMPSVGLHDPEIQDVEAMPFVNPNLTSILRIKNKAESARQKFLSEEELSSNSEYFADVEYNNTLKYWVVVYGLSVDDQPAYTVNGIDWVENYVQNKLGSKFYGAYESFAIEIIEEVGLELKDLDGEEENTEESIGLSVD